MADGFPLTPVFASAFDAFAAEPLLVSVLDHTREAAYLSAIAAGKYQPELLFPKHSEIVERIRLHPALLWKAQNVTQFLARSKKPS